MPLISSNLSDTAAALSRLPGDVEFAGVVALTRTGGRIQKVIQAQADVKFDLKNKFTIRSVRLAPATKQKVEARIFTTYEALTVQDEGGKRSNRSVFFIPGKQFEKRTGINPRKKVIRKRFRGSNILNTSFPIEKTGKGKSRAKPFLFQVKSGARLIGLRQSGDSLPLDILYVTVRRAVSIRKRPFFEEPAEGEYDAAFQEEYDKAFDQFVKLR